MIAIISAISHVTLNLFQGLTFAASKIKMLKQVQHDGLLKRASL